MNDPAQHISTVHRTFDFRRYLWNRSMLFDALMRMSVVVASDAFFHDPPQVLFIDDQLPLRPCVVVAGLVGWKNLIRPLPRSLDGQTSILVKYHGSDRYRRLAYLRG
jgi:hypothetical protein